MKTCTKCKLEQPISNFNKCVRWLDGLQKQCKACHKALNKLHYNTEPSAYIARAAQQRVDVREFIQFVKQESGCTICSERRWWCLDFHHTDPAVKEEAVSKLNSLPAVIREIQKCRIVCRNCHADIHYKERI